MTVTVRSFGQLRLRLQQQLVVSVTATILVASQSAFAEQVKLTAEDDAQVDAIFGNSVAFEGSFVLVGAPGEDSGAVYVFGPDGTPDKKLTAQNVAGFGASVGITGTTALVGAPNTNSSTGAALLFDLTSGQEIDRFDGPGGTFDHFGFSVAIEGNTAVVGAPDEDTTKIGAGAVYLFDTATDASPIRIEQDTVTSFAEFGQAVAIDGDRVLVGAPGAPADGAAYLFDAATGEFIVRLDNPNPNPGDDFGGAVAIQGNLGLIGAPGDEGLVSDVGAAYLFDLDPISSSFGELIAEFRASDAQNLDFFGTSVALSDDLAIIGAALGGTAADPDAGSVYLFDISSGDAPQSEIAEFTAGDADDGDRFGSSVALAGNRAVVGASFDDEEANDAGAAYLLTVPEPSGIVLAALGLSIFCVVCANTSRHRGATATSR